MFAGLLSIAGMSTTGQAQVIVPEPPPVAPRQLSSVPVPLPPNLNQFVYNRNAAIELGKALFWDIQVGSDGKTACASCHFNAGADNRTRNTLSPREGLFRGADSQLTGADFPFHKLTNPDEPTGVDNPVVSDTSEVVGSQGVIKQNFLGINALSRRDNGLLVPDPTFHVGGINCRQVTGRNAPTVINAVFTDRNFWDGRANRFFNGVNPFGDTDPDAKIWISNLKGALSQTRILLDNASLASQAVGPSNNEVEMSWNGRTFPILGRKVLALRPLDLQQIHRTDSVLGVYASRTTGYLNKRTTYADLVRRAFWPKYWLSKNPTPAGDTQMEANFSLFWGLSIMMYESTLVSDRTPFDFFALGNKRALSPQATEGLRIFLNEGKCIACHSGPEFTGAAVSQLRGAVADQNEPMIELMAMANGVPAFYDSGFYNIGVRPTEEDLGLGGRHPLFGPFALSRRAQEGQIVPLHGTGVTVSPGDRIAVDGAFKTPSLRNVELTGPYMHNGGMRTLDEVVQFYTRGTDFGDVNIDNLDPEVDGIPELRGNPAGQAALIAFLKSLTDERVRKQSAPFDHPSIPIPEGTAGSLGSEVLENTRVIPAVGRFGGPSLLPFSDVLR